MLITMDRLVAEYGVRPTSVLHVGAHLAEEASAYQDAGVAHVLWVEANPHLLSRLQQVVSGYHGQHVAQAAISDTNGMQVNLNLASFSMSSSLLPMKEHLKFYPTIVKTGEEPMRTITVDSLMRELSYPPDAFDMANLDIEGAELFALRGMTACLPYLKWLYAEVNLEEMYEGCALLGDIDGFLEPRGFRRVALEDALLDGRGVGWGDALYARTRAE